MYVCMYAYNLKVFEQYICNVFFFLEASSHQVCIDLIQSTAKQYHFEIYLKHYKIVMFYKFWLVVYSQLKFFSFSSFLLT